MSSKRTSSIDELSRKAGERYRREDEAKAKAALRPTKPKSEPGRARPRKRSQSVSLGEPRS